MLGRHGIKLLAALLVIAAGCGDLTGSQRGGLAPGPVQLSGTVMTPEGEVPWYPDESQVPADLAKAGVYDVKAEVHWEGPVARGTASSVFNGNRGEMKINMSILRGTTTVATPHEEHPFAAPIIQQFRPTRMMGFAIGGSCDYVVNFHVFQSAKVVIGIAEYVIDWSTSSGDADDHAIQPACVREEIPDEGGGEEGGGTGGPGGGDPKVTCRTTTYEIQVWNGSEWQHERYEYETQCF